MQALIAQAARTVAQAIHDDPRNGVIISGGSNQLSRALLTMGWISLYPKTKLPRLFVFPRELNSLMYKSPDPLDIQGHKILEWIERYHPALAATCSQPQWFLDDFIVGGDKCRDLRLWFKKAGYCKLRFVVFAKPRLERSTRFIEAATTSSEVVRQLYRLSLLIQGQADIKDVLKDIKQTPRERRLEALAYLRKVSHILANR